MPDHLPRRGLLGAALAATSLLGSSPVRAEATWPVRPVRVVVPFPPGQSMDVLPRILGEALTQRLSYPFVFENRAGGVGVPGTEAVVRATPDGHMLGIGAMSTLAVNPALLPHLPYDPERDLTPVARVFAGAQAVVVHPSVPVRTVQDLVDWLRVNPGTRYGSAGPATTPHLAAELLARRLGLVLEHVAYRGSGPAMADLVAGVLPLMVDSASSALPQARAGRVRLLAVTTAARLPSWPDTPTVAETVSPGFEVVGWGGLVAPASTPSRLVEAINAAVQAGLRDPVLVDRFAEFGAVPTPGTAGDFAAIVRAEAARWGELVRALGIRLDG
jgi:tripartite-type tricarboxylate transporter receptor subunit TctC